MQKEAVTDAKQRPGFQIAEQTAGLSKSSAKKRATKSAVKKANPKK